MISNFVKKCSIDETAMILYFNVEIAPWALVGGEIIWIKSAWGFCISLSNISLPGGGIFFHVFFENEI
jgi:hypothetical protein